MKKTIFNLTLICTFCMLMSSCYTYTYNVGSGPKTGLKMEEKNHYLVYGLVPLKTSDPVKLAGGATDYQVTIQHTFIDGLINSLTMGLYSPTTTTVTK